jgi:hypothetical protein
MSWRGLVALVALLAAGIVGGFATAELLQSSPVTTGEPEPVTAESPSFPSNPRQPLEPDPPQEPLQTNLPMRDVSLGSGGDRIVFKAPRGWSRLGQLSNEVKYKKPNNPNYTYVMRVEQVTSDHEQIATMIEDRIADLRDDETQVKVLYRTHDQLEVSYVHENYRRYALYTWLDVRRSGQAEVEIAITGRSVDVPGMRELMARVWRGMEPG